MTYPLGAWHRFTAAGGVKRLTGWWSETILGVDWLLLPSRARTALKASDKQLLGFVVSIDALSCRRVHKQLNGYWVRVPNLQTAPRSARSFPLASWLRLLMRLRVALLMYVVVSNQYCYEL